MLVAITGAAMVVVVLDRWSKARVGAHAPGRWRVTLAPGVSLRHVRAPIGWRTPRVSAALLLLTVSLLVALLMTGGVFTTLASWLGLGAAVAGAASNVYDRMRNRCIIDFVCVGWWPAFNVADVAIVVGAGTALLSLGSAGMS
jgi:lipoprotein signal peptidase